MGCGGGLGPTFHRSLAARATLGVNTSGNLDIIHAFMRNIYYIWRMLRQMVISTQGTPCVA
jgi:hypothetical protein